MRVWITPVSEADGGAARAPILYALDTTDLRLVQEQLAQSQKMNAVGQLAGGVAHDFNNVLQAIIGYSDLLLANHRPTDPSFQDIMQIKQNANRAASLVRQLLAFSRRQTLRPEVLNLGDRLSDLSHAAQAPARRAGRARPQPRPRPLARQGGREPVRAGDREPRRQCPRRHAERRQARDPHRATCRRPRRRGSAVQRHAARPTTWWSRWPTPAPA